MKPLKDLRLIREAVPVDKETLCDEDLKLIGVIRAIGYGEANIKIRASKPVIVEKGIMTIKLENN